MSDLEPINFNQFKKHQELSKSNSAISEIQNIIFEITKIKVNIKKYQPPVLVITAPSASAASELNLSKQVLLSKISQYNLSQITIVIQ